MRGPLGGKPSAAPLSPLSLATGERAATDAREAKSRWHPRLCTWKAVRLSERLRARGRRFAPRGDPSRGGSYLWRIGVQAAQRAAEAERDFSGGRGQRGRERKARWLVRKAQPMTADDCTTQGGAAGGGGGA